MIKLSVFMLAYNHERYIKKAIDSVLMQEVNFDYEIIIGEDCSTDHTRTVIRDYKELYPDKIKLILHEKNVGVTFNAIEVARNCTGLYIAFLDGDDYWTDKNKLQKSVDFLEHNPDYISTAHDVSVIDENNKLLHDTPFGKYKGDLHTPIDQFKYNNLPTLSIVFKNVWREDFPAIYEKLLNNVTIVADYPLKLLLLSKGKIKYFNEKMGTYRWIRSSGSSFSAKQKKDPNLFKVELVNSLLNLCDMDTDFVNLFNSRLKIIECEIVLYYCCTFKILELSQFRKKYLSKKKLMDKLNFVMWLIILFFYKLFVKLVRNLRLLIASNKKHQVLPAETWN